MTQEEQESILQVLEQRFMKNGKRHPGVEWLDVRKVLLAKPGHLDVLQAMEESGGEPDLVTFSFAASSLIYCDCAAESPAGRRSLCYDRAALDARKENKPANSVVDLANSIGVRLLNETEYRELQTFGEFDKKTSSWIQTPESIRSLGGALFCDRRYNHVFTYHNGADSYYGARGFRALYTLESR